MIDYLRNLDSKLLYIKHTIEDGIMKITCETAPTEDRPVHSRQERIVKDLPLGEYKVELHILAKKYFNDNPSSKKQTIAETFDFVSARGRRTKRLDRRLLQMTGEMSTIGLERLVRKQFVDVSDTTILRIVKKNNEDQIKL